VTAGSPRDRPVTGVIVAGGENQRFGGVPKGLARVGGERIIDRVATAIRSVTRHVLLVANAPDAAGWLPGVTVIRDSRPERGSVVGLYTALAGASDARLVVAWDMPFVSADLLRLIVGRLVDGAAAVVPDGPLGPEPFCAAYTVECLPSIETAIERREFRMSSVVERLPKVVRVTVDEIRRFGEPERLFFNVNDGADLDAAERMLGE
jgi:molybdenum cofactor guanylyltransferase